MFPQTTNGIKILLKYSHKWGNEKIYKKYSFHKLKIDCDINPSIG